mmetsp:Transcript_13159/g.20826  ORF Transcript_13159/g.20826 Transcript_13159/m.20826 type:complete len:85 (+) Transcript_13159:212-466(+)
MLISEGEVADHLTEILGGESLLLHAYVARQGPAFVLLCLQMGLQATLLFKGMVGLAQLGSNLSSQEDSNSNLGDNDSDRASLEE